MPTVRLTLVPHTHWDREWYQPFEEFRERLVQMMDTLIDLLDRGFPHFHLDGQTALIDDYLEVRPERAPDLERLTRAGKLSVGPWFTQMDEFLTSGESMIRNLERGMARARSLGTPLPPIGHLPDQFGHVGQMPQLLARAGIDRAVLWRGVPSRIAHTEFWWESPDGSRVLVEYLPFGYGLGGWLHQARDAAHLDEQLQNAVNLLRPFAPAADRFLVMMGGDHHGPDPKLLDRLAEVATLDPGIDARVGSLADHLTDPPPRDAQVWRGELRSAHRAHLLPGVYSTRIDQKQTRAWLEGRIERYAEPLAALVPGAEWPESELDRIWQLLLWNGAHDSVCGCSVDQVARDVDERHREAAELTNRIVDRSMDQLLTQCRTPGVLRFNPSPFEREGVPGLGWRLDDEPATSVPERLVPSVQDGWLVAGGIAVRLMDEPDVGDLYNFCPMDGSDPTGPDSYHALGKATEARFGDDLQVDLRLSRSADDPFIRVDGRVRNDRPDHRLRLHLGLTGPVSGVIAGAPFELVERGFVSEGGTETASRTWPARGFVLAGGVAVLAGGVIEYEVLGARELAITLLRCVGTISRGQMPVRNWAAGPDIPTPGAQMQGTWTFALAVAPGTRPEGLIGTWERFALPVISRPATATSGAGPSSGTLLEIDGVALSGVRRHGGHLVATVWNPRSAPTSAVVGGRRIPLGGCQIETVVLD